MAPFEPTRLPTMMRTPRSPEAVQDGPAALMHEGKRCQGPEGGPPSKGNMRCTARAGATLPGIARQQPRGRS
eukprot:9463790-Alexandrium_andersonii.AAC.1